MPNTYSLAELAELADVTPRTVRYYIAQGLLPSPAQAGPGTRYAEVHLERLQLIRQLQREHLPLAEIRARMSVLGDDQVRQLLSERPGARAAESAIDYIRGVLASPGRSQTTFALAMRPAAARLSGLQDEEPLAAPALVQPGERAEPAAASSVRPPDRSQWDRINLGPDVELHVRRPLSRIQNKRVERLIAIARELLEEDDR